MPLPASHHGVLATQQDQTHQNVLQHMARLDLRVDTVKGATLISFQSLYLDYLDENGFIDPKDVKPTKPQGQQTQQT